MKKNNILRIIILLFIFISLITIGIVTSLRMKNESKNNSVEIIMEYQELKRLASRSKYSMKEWLIELKSVGLNSVAIMEETLLKYISNNGSTYQIANELFNSGNWEQLYPEEVVERLKEGNDYNLLIETNSKIEYETMTNGLSHYEEINFWNKEIDNSYYIIIDQTEDDILYADSNEIYTSSGNLVGKNRGIFGTEVLNAPIGFDSEKIGLIEEAGLKLVLRPVNYDKEPMNAWKLYLSEIEKYGIGSGLLLFDGEGVAGFGAENDIYVSAIQEFIAENKMKIVLTETMEQRQYSKTKGLPPVVESLSKDNFVRLFNIWDFIARRYQYNAYYTGGEEIGNSIYRAVTERNIRAVYFRPFIKSMGGYVTNMEDYKEMFRTLEGRLERHGYYYGDATTFEDFALPLYAKVAITLQIALFGLLLLNLIFKNIKLKINIAAIIIAILGSLSAHYIAPNMAVKLTALAAAVIFSTMSVVYFIRNYLLNSKSQSIMNSVKSLIITSLISLMGALYIGSIMSDTEFLLEIKLFSGVKASLLAPIAGIILVVVIFYIMEMSSDKENNFIKESLDTVKTFLNANIKIKYGILLIIIGVIGYIYLARSGNESNLEPMRIEIMLRNFLEDVLIARPRTKEFTLAFPSMIIGAYFAKKILSKKEIILKYLYTLVFAVLAIIGQTSITNTFSHIRTPLYLSLARVGYSILFSIVIGIIGIGVFKILGMILNKIMVYYQLNKE